MPIESLPSTDRLECPTNSNPEPIRLKFCGHGLGDCVHAALALQLYRRRGYEVTVQIEPNKHWIWQVSGVTVHQGEDELPHHPYEYVPSINSFFDLNLPDHSANKVAGFFAHPALPSLGSPEAVWEELCQTRLDATPWISAAAHSEAEAFLEGLPRPVFVLHSKGSNWQDQKSIPDGVAFELIRRLLNETTGSVIILDYDARAPSLSGHPRCQAIKPDWGHIGCDRLCALLLRSDLLIGVDSGPFHVASLVDVQALGVFRGIPAVRCCLPNPNATYLVPARQHSHWKLRESEWRFAEYHGEEVTARDIADLAIDLVTPQERPSMEINPSNIPGRYLYRRVGHDERPMVLAADGKITTGAGGCERAWKIEPTPTGPVVTIYGDHGGPTCHLRLAPDDILRGKWLHFEKMPIELIREPPVPIPVHREQGHPSDSKPDAPVEFYVGIPTYNCFDLLDRCIDAVLASTWIPKRIYIIDNSCGKYEGHRSRRVQVITPTHNLGAGGSLNFLFPAIAPKPLIQLNDDIEVAEDLLQSMMNCDADIIVADGSSSNTAILIRNEAWRKVGPMDPQFWPAYLEDCDWQYRASLAGLVPKCPPSGGYRDNGPSATKQRMSLAERTELDKHYEANCQYYRDKWGGSPHQEVFRIPFDGVPQG